MRVKPLLAMALVGVVAGCGGDGSSDGEPPFLVADITDEEAVAAMEEDFLACLEERMAARIEDLGVDPEAEPPAGGGLFDIGERRGRTIAVEFVDCAIEQQLAAADEIEADPASVEVIVGEAAGNARNACCLRVLPPASSRGDTSSTAGAAPFIAAVADELTAHRLARFASAQADCVAGTLFGLVEPDRPVTAAELVDYRDGGYEPFELGFDVDETTAAELATAAIECAGTEMLRLTALFDGNIEDALGRPSEPAAENDELVECSFAAVDLDVVEAFVAQQFAHGPDAWRAPEGRTLLEESFAAVQGCADDLGIPRQEPLNGI